MCIMLYNVAKNCKIKNVNFKMLIFKLKTHIKNCYKIQSFAKHQNVKLNEDIITMINDTLRYDNYIINKNIDVIRHRKKKSRKYDNSYLVPIYEKIYTYF